MMTLAELRELVNVRLADVPEDTPLVHREVSGRLTDFEIEPELVFRDSKDRISIDVHDERVLLMWLNY